MSSILRVPRLLMPWPPPPLPPLPRRSRRAAWLDRALAFFSLGNPGWNGTAIMRNASGQITPCGGCSQQLCPGQTYDPTFGADCASAADPNRNWIPGSLTVSIADAALGDNTQRPGFWTGWGGSPNGTYCVPRNTTQPGNGLTWTGQLSPGPLTPPASWGATTMSTYLGVNASAAGCTNQVYWLVEMSLVVTAPAGLAGNYTAFAAKTGCVDLDCCWSSHTLSQWDNFIAGPMAGGGTSVESACC